MTVMIGIPVADYFLTVDLALFLCEASKKRMKIETCREKNQIEHSRNVLCESFLRSGYDKLWMIDSDGIPSPNSFDLLDTKGDIVGGLVPVSNKSPNWNAYHRDNRGNFLPIPHGLRGNLGCDAVGAACMILTRPVVEKLGATFRFRRNIDGSILMGEDIDYCVRAKERGFSVVANADVRWGHAKTVNLANFHGLR